MSEPPRQPEQLRWLRSKIVARPPYCQGTLALPDSDFTLFYGTEGNAHRINLSASSPAQLQHLAETCAPATFGVAGEDVYDETYRKAGKLDNKDFSIGFDVRTSSLVDVIRTELLVENPKRVRSEDLNIELYKLNVYGKDAFFKAHVDTPRSELMFGSLVIVFPTPHEGGALKLRAPGNGEGETSEWTFDPSALLAQQDQPSIAYVAFFSDVEHEVMPVTSGHRVTITYNLFYALASQSDPSLPAHSIPKQISTNEQSFTDALRAVLADPSFLPVGGNLMFGLRHQYPLATPFGESGGRFARQRDADAWRKTSRAALRALESEGRLKATDGVMLRALRGCGLDVGLKVMYEARWSQWERTMGYVVADGVLPLPHVSEMIQDSAVEFLQGEGGELVQDAVVLMRREIEREKAKAEAKVRAEAKAKAKAEAEIEAKAKAEAEAKAKAEAEAKAKAEAEEKARAEAEANPAKGEVKVNEDKAEATADKEKDKDEAKSEGEDEDEDDEDDGEDEGEDEEEDEDDYEYQHAIGWYRDDEATPVFWVTDPPIARSGKGFQRTIQTYGNEPCMDVVYWRIWIFARVGPAGQRETAQGKASK